MNDMRMVGLIPQGGVLDTETGEVYPTIQDAPTQVLARILGRVQLEIDQNLEALYEAKRVLGGEVMQRMDRSGEWTLRAPGVKLVAPSPAQGTLEWDAEMLDEILDELVAEGVIDQAAKLRAVEPKVELKVNKRGVTALCKIPLVRDRIAPARRTVTPQRKVSVRVNPRELR
jgi:hypothetical protein